MSKFPLLGVVVTWLMASSAGAQDPAPPDLTSHWRFLRSSTLRETGGFAGVDVTYRVLGTYDFVKAIAPPPADGAYAKFTNVDAWAAHPILAYVRPLDQVLNLSGLKGIQLPVAAPFDVFQFTGTTDDGSSVNILVSDLGRWMYLRGGTTPPAGSADFFSYELRAVARRRPFADFTADDLVDGQDLAQWAGRFGASSVGGGLDQPGDADGDGVVDGADLLTWQQQAGETPPDMAMLDAAIDAAIAPALASVPEPGSAALLAAAGVIPIVFGRKNRGKFL